jgi:hypothetical protein
VGVVGALGGAGIGGTVTVLSLFFKGHQDEAAEKRRHEREEAQRKDDRAWALRLQNHEDRQSLYSRLLRSGADVRDKFRNLLLKADDWHRQEIADAALNEFRDATAAAEVKSIDRTVIEIADDIVAEGNSSTYFLEGMGDPKARQYCMKSVVRITNELLPALRDACRRDLGYDDSPADPLS